MLLADLTEKCGVFGAVTEHSYTARVTYYGLWALQHRGQEGSGIASWDGQRMHSRVGAGLVAHVYDPGDLERLDGCVAIGHNRYSTSGADGGAHAQPVIDRDLDLAFAHNGNLPSTKVLEAFLRKHHINPRPLNDSEMMTRAIGVYLRDGMSLEDAVVAAWPLFTGAFSCVVMQEGQLVAFRDECGIRPLALGKLEDGYCVSSESCAFDTVGAAFLREVKPGELVSLTAEKVTARQVVTARPKLDVFELVYFARPDSLIAGRKVNEVRREMGRQLAREFPVVADVVIPVPDSGIPMALGYSEQSGVRFDHGFIKNRYIHRTFIKPTQVMRERDVRVKLNPVPEVVMGKSVVVIDDSIVRGTTTGQIVGMLYGAGARNVHVLVSSPPVLYPDFYGINTPSQTELIAANRSVEEIREHIGADSLGYLSVAGMVKATGLARQKLNLSCFTGEYPIDIGERALTIQKVSLDKKPVLV